MLNLLGFFFIQQVLLEHLLCAHNNPEGTQSPLLSVSPLGLQAVCGVQMSSKVLCGPMSLVFNIPRCLYNGLSCVLWSREQVDSYQDGQKGWLTLLAAFPFQWACLGDLGSGWGREPKDLSWLSS